MTINSMDSDVKARLDALMAAFFAAVSFEEGGKPSYQDLYDLFIPSGLLIRASDDQPEIATVSQFIEPRQKRVDSGELVRFREAETAEITEIFGNVAQRFSTYTKSGLSGGSPIEGQGVISIQFIRVGGSWKISSMAWDDERPGLVIPQRYRTTVSR